MTPTLSPMQLIDEGYAGRPPDWIVALAREVDATSQGRAAKRIGYSGPTISQLLRNKYPAGTGPIEERVRGILMREEIDCPVLGLIGKAECQDWRKKARAFAGNNPMRVRMARGCRRCSLWKGGSDDAS